MLLRILLGQRLLAFAEASPALLLVIVRKAFQTPTEPPFTLVLGEVFAMIEAALKCPWSSSR